MTGQHHGNGSALQLQVRLVGMLRLDHGSPNLVVGMATEYGALRDNHEAFYRITVVLRSGTNR